VVHERRGDVARDDLKALSIALARCGWEIRVLDIDLVAGRLVAQLHRYDGRWLHVAADDIGRASVERWHRSAVVTRYRGGPQCDGHEDQFLGRTRCEGPRQAMRVLCAYVADNPAPGFAQLSAPEVRTVFAPVMK
jgi:hypothetical protein